MTDITPAVSGSDAGTVLVIEVSAGSKKASFPSGYNAWRKAVGCTVRARAIGGKANLEVVRNLAAFFDVPVNRVRIVAGAASPLKRVLIEGLDPGEVERAILAVLSNI
jgi:uncharacterized protein (TIGR00251 family)